MSPAFFRRFSSALHRDLERMGALERVAVVEGIPAIVCRACGAEYCDDSSSLVQNFLRGDGFRTDDAVSHLEVPVFRFGDHIAKGRG